MKISVIVPVYNCEDYLRQCLESLVNQTLKSIEILIVDDGSTDASLSIAKEFESIYSEKIKVFSKANGGQGSARNLALLQASGEYLGFVDSDDWVDLDLYKTMCETADIHNYDIVVCDMFDHFPNQLLHHHATQFKNKFMQTPSACNKIFRKSLVSELTFPEGYWYEDFDFTTKALLLTDNIGTVERVGYHCHCREVSTMFNHNSLKNLDMLYVFDDLITFAKDKGLYDRYRDDFEYMIIEHILITTVNRVALQKNDKKKEVIKKLIAYAKEKLPNFEQTNAFRGLPRNRKIIAKLNAEGFYNISKTILNISKKLKSD